MKKRLYRAPESESMIGGVCAGIANYFDIDPTLIRLLWVLVTFFSFIGTGIIVYIIAWIIIPRKNNKKIKKKN